MRHRLKARWLDDPRCLLVIIGATEHGHRELLTGLRERGLDHVLDKRPKSVQPKVKSDLHEIYLAETREGAHQAFDSKHLKTVPGQVPEGHGKP